MRVITAEFDRRLVPFYEIWFSESPELYIPKMLKNFQASSWWIVTDDQVYTHVYPLIQHLLPEHHVIVLTSGEAHKQLSSCEEIWDAMHGLKADRKAVMIGLGGGVVTDIAGFSAACWKRGIQYISIPTSLLGMLDASVGGKTGSDYHDGKNVIGLFSSPALVITDPGWLKTLPAAHIRSGFAEALKHGLITDASYWSRLSSSDLLSQAWDYVIYRSMLIKNDIVKQDPDEQWVRKILNFGHSIGHALESVCLTQGKTLLHGDAVALGMMVESGLSTHFSGLPYSVFQEISAAIQRFHFPLPDLDFEDTHIQELFVDALLQDKKNSGMEVRMALLSNIGVCRHDVVVPVSEALNATRALFSQFHG